MESYKLDKVLDTETQYTTEADTALIVNSIGSGTIKMTTAKVNGVPCCEFNKNMGPIETNDTNRLPLFDLKKNYIVIPPDKTFEFAGVSGESVEIKGYILKLGPNEALPAGHTARYGNQGNKFVSYQQGAEASDQTLASEGAATILSFTCPTGEKWTFNSLFMAKLMHQTGPAIDYGLTSRISVEDKPYDNLINSKVDLGIHQHGTPYPPNDTDGVQVFSFEDRPIELEGGDTLKIEAYNTTGSSIALDAESKALIVGVKEYV